MRSKGRPRPRTARGAAGSGSDDSDADRDPEPEGEVGRKLTWVPSDTADAVAAVAGQNGDVRVQGLFLSFFLSFFLSLSLSLSLSLHTCICISMYISVARAGTRRRQRMGEGQDSQGDQGG